VLLMDKTEGDPDLFWDSPEKTEKNYEKTLK
jgi:hypothetical protein